MRKGLIALIFWLASATAGLCQGVLPVPALAGHVIDSTGTLSASQQQQLEARLTAFEAASGSQIVVLMVSSTQPEDIAVYANRVANTWKIGRRDIGDGVLVVIAKDDRKLRIEVAKALEGAIPDLAAKRVIDGSMTPGFRQGDFAGGIDSGLNQLMALIKGEALPVASTSSAQARPDFDWTGLAVFMFIFVPVAGTIARTVFGGRLGAVLTGLAVAGMTWLASSVWLVALLAGVAAFFVTLVSGLGRALPVGRRAGTVGGLGAGGWSTGSGGGSDSHGSSGGFSSGGGGDFGGGGASGSW